MDAREGDTLMRSARAGGVEGIVAECGGCLTCLTCQCEIDPADAARIPPPDEDEAAMIDSLPDPAPTTRLSCQIRVGAAMDGMIVTVPEWQG